jgi:hypothetical protein
VIQAVSVVEGVHVEVFQCVQVPEQKAGFPVQLARPLCKYSGRVQNLQLLQSKVQGYIDQLRADLSAELPSQKRLSATLLLRAVLLMQKF